MSEWYYHDLVKVLYRTDYNHSDQEDHEGSGSEPQVIRAQPDGSVTIKSRVQYNFDNKRQNTLNHWRANSKHFHSQTLTKPRHGLVNICAFYYENYKKFPPPNFGCAACCLFYLEQSTRGRHDRDSSCGSGIHLTATAVEGSTDNKAWQTPTGKVLSASWQVL